MTWTVKFTPHATRPMTGDVVAIYNEGQPDEFVWRAGFDDGLDINKAVQSAIAERDKHAAKAAADQSLTAKIEGAFTSTFGALDK